MLEEPHAFQCPARAPPTLGTCWRCSTWTGWWPTSVTGCTTSTGASRRGYPDWGAFFRAAGRDPLLPEGAALVRDLAREHEIVWLTGRPDWLRRTTLSWFERHGLPTDELHMRPGPRLPTGARVQDRGAATRLQPARHRGLHRRRPGGRGRRRGGRLPGRARRLGAAGRPVRRPCCARRRSATGGPDRTGRPQVVVEEDGHDEVTIYRGAERLDQICPKFLFDARTNSGVAPLKVPQSRAHL